MSTDYVCAAHKYYSHLSVVLTSGMPWWKMFSVIFAVTLGTGQLMRATKRELRAKSSFTFTIRRDRIIFSYAESGAGGGGGRHNKF